MDSGFRCANEIFTLYGGDDNFILNFKDCEKKKDDDEDEDASDDHIQNTDMRLGGYFAQCPDVDWGEYVAL